MKAYRNNMGIMADLLQAAQESGRDGIKPTALLAKANLSHTRLSKFMTNLTGAGLITKIEHGGKYAFAITPKGRQYMEHYARFHGMAESFGLDL